MPFSKRIQIPFHSILLSLENKKQFEFVEDRWKTLIFSSLFFFPQEKVVNYESMIVIGPVK